MEFGITLTPHIRDYEYVKLAEQLGYSQAWFYDSQMIYSDVYATMALCAKETSRIKLGTGVAVPTTRIAPVIAHSIATIAELAPGRVELGVGNGNTARLTMGLPPVTLGKMKKEIRVIQALLRGEVVDIEMEGKTNPVQLMHRNHGFVNLGHKIPLTLSAFGPKTLAYCGYCPLSVSFYSPLSVSFLLIISSPLLFSIVSSTLKFRRVRSIYWLISRKRETQDRRYGYHCLVNPAGHSTKIGKRQS